MKNLVFLFILLTSVGTYGQKQKITVDEDTIKVDGVNYAIMIKKGSASPDYLIQTMDGKDLMYFRFADFYNPNKINNSNPKGRVCYFEVTFFGDQKKCEVNPALANRKSIAKEVVENNLILNGAINQSAEDKYVLINGMRFTEEQKNMNGSVIIINH